LLFSLHFPPLAEPEGHSTTLRNSKFIPSRLQYSLRRVGRVVTRCNPAQLKVFRLERKELAKRTKKDQKPRSIELVIIPKLPPLIGDHCLAKSAECRVELQPIGHRPVSKRRTERFSPSQCLEIVAGVGLEVIDANTDNSSGRRARLA